MNGQLDDIEKRAEEIAERLVPSQDEDGEGVYVPSIYPSEIREIAYRAAIAGARAERERLAYQKCPDCGGSTVTAAGFDQLQKEMGEKVAQQAEENARLRKVIETIAKDEADDPVLYAAGVLDWKPSGK